MRASLRDDEKVSFLTLNEKRAAVGYAPLEAAPAGPDGEGPAVVGKYNPNQPRAPRGTSEGGQWVDEGGGDGINSSDRPDLENIRTAGIRGRALRELLGWFLRLKPDVPKDFVPKHEDLPDFLVPKAREGKLTGDITGLTLAERRFVEEQKNLGNDVEILPRGPGRTADMRLNGQKVYEYKHVSRVRRTDEEGLSAAVTSRVLDARGQSRDIIIDAREQDGMNRAVAQRVFRRAYIADRKKGIDSITILTPEGPVSAPRID